jgi:hypothetical protein
MEENAAESAKKFYILTSKIGLATKTMDHASLPKAKQLQLFIHFQNFQLSKKAFRRLSRWCHLSTYPLRPLRTWSIKGAEPCRCLAPERSWQRDIGSTKHKKVLYVLHMLV